MPRAGMERPPFNHRILSTDHKDLQNITTSNEFQDTAIQMQSFHSSFNSDYQGKDAFQLERNAGRSKATGHDWSMYSQRFYNHDNLYHGEILDDYSPDYSPSLTAQDNVSWGSSSSLLDHLRLPWVHDDGESLPRYPLSPSPTPPRIPYSVVAVRPQHARTYPGFWTQDEWDGSYDGSSFRSCGQGDNLSWMPPPRLAFPLALDPQAAPRRWGDRLHRRRTSAPEIHAASPGVGSSGRPRPKRGPADHKQLTLGAAKRMGPPLQAGGALQIDSDVVLALPPPPPQLRAAFSPTIGDAIGAAAGMRPSAKGPLRPAIRVRGRTRSAEAAMAPEQAALRAAFGEMVRGRRDSARSWMRARALALARGGCGLDSEDHRHHGPGGPANGCTEAGAAGAAVATEQAVPRATSAGGRAEHSAPTSGKGEHGGDGGSGDGCGEGQPRWQLQATVTGAWTRNAAELPPTWRRPVKQDEEQEEEEKADAPPCGCVPFGRPAAPSVPGRGGGASGSLLGRAARRLRRLSGAVSG